MRANYLTGGEGGIRTHGTLTRTLVFETSPIGHSGTSPSVRVGAATAASYIAGRGEARAARQSIRLEVF
jgi:hypothetical protein